MVLADLLRRRLLRDSLRVLRRTRGLLRRNIVTKRRGATIIGSAAWHGAALAGFYMDQYGVVIDPTMLANVLHTDANEVRDLLSWSLPGTVLVISRDVAIIATVAVINLAVDVLYGVKAIDPRLAVRASLAADVALPRAERARLLVRRLGAVAVGRGGGARRARSCGGGPRARAGHRAPDRGPRPAGALPFRDPAAGSVFPGPLRATPRGARCPGRCAPHAWRWSWGSATGSNCSAEAL